MVSEYEPSELIERMAQAHEDELIGGPDDGHTMKKYVYAERETDAPSNICPKCKFALDDHNGYMGDGPKCEEELR